MAPLATPDGRYIVVRGRLWRASDPHMNADEHRARVHDLMDARRAVAAGRKAQDVDAIARARVAVQTAKVALGERGPPWWTDGAPDLNRRLIGNTPYGDWWAQLSDDERR